MKKSIKQRLATLAVAGLALTGVSAGTVALAAPAQAATYKSNFVWVNFMPAGKQCQWFTRVDYSWGEEFWGGYKDYSQFNGYAANSWCGR